MERTRVLIIDDEVAITTALRRHLAVDHDVTVANDPHAALDLVRQGRAFDVILCDHRMPKMSGVQLHAELAEISPAQAAATVLMTGSTTDTGVLPRLAKPFDLDELKAVIAAVGSTVPGSRR